MAQNYRNQNESGRWQDYPRSSHRGSSGRDRYETGNERRFRPDWEERFSESGHQEEGFEGDRSYSAGGYPEEFGYRRDQSSERDRGGYQRHSQENRDERFGGSYYDRPYASQGRNHDYGSRDFGQGSQGGYQSGGGYQGGSMGGSIRSQGQRYDFNREQGDRGADFNRGREDYNGSSLNGGGSSNYYGSQGAFGNTSGSMLGRGSGSEHFGLQGQQQSHRGRGPKGYERSDERLREMVCERLTDDPSIDASEISIEVTNKVVKLTGSVDDRRTKYLVEDVIEQVGGVRDIDNQLRVQQQSGQSQTSQFGTSSNDSGQSGRSINVGQSGSVGQSSNIGQSTTTSPSKRN
jgi:osmotically-inducible protein OsmY